MHINVFADNNFLTQIFDKWYAYQQSIGNSFCSPYKVTLEKYVKEADLNICVLHMPSKVPADVGLYDIVFLANANEPLIVATSTMVDFLKKDNVYLLANAYLPSTHQLASKVVWVPDDPLKCLSYWTSSFYPNFYSNMLQCNRVKTKKLVGINGENRSWRHHFFALLQQSIPSIPIKSSYSTLVETNDALWESDEDNEFRVFVNDLYEDNITRNLRSLYYSNSVTIGIDSKFGSIPPGYFILDEYYDYYGVIFPESTWQNNELCITEKALKCFYTQTFPIPVGGANINRYYNELGFYTAWNLLPEDLRLFDTILDHNNRYTQLVRAIEWLEKNPKVFTTNSSIEMLKQNKENLLTNNIEFVMTSKFSNFLNKVIDQ